MDRTLGKGALHERSSLAADRRIAHPRQFPIRATMTVRLRLFGPPAIADGREGFALPFERRGQLIAFLALRRGWVGRADLAAMLWPDQEDKLAYTNLRKTLFRLQSAPWAPPIEVQGAALRLDADTDVAEFETALKDGRIADALALRTGELLKGFEDDDNNAWSSWLGYERDRLRTVWRTAALDRLGAGIEPREGIDLSGRLLDADPLDEAALRAHMSSLARDGQAGRARQAYREFVERIEEDLGLGPSPALKALHDSLGTPAAQATPGPAAASRAAEAGFVGRVVELRRMASLLAQDDCRLLTILGPGGVGKTRLAQRAARDLARGYTDGVTFVPLEDCLTLSDLGGQLARELGVPLTAKEDSLDRVTAFLKPRHMLLVLDNVEQLAAHASVLERLLEAAPRLRIAVTSRVRLGLTAEWLLPLAGLPTPEVEDEDHAEAFDAVRLFIQAAHRVEPALVPSVETASIVEICRQVEGLPLALELAAAWTRVLPCDAIAAELRRGTELLHAADAAQPARHASMDVVFDHSWRLLTPVERDALARLSVFRGGFSAEAARAVAGASLPVLGALADKSLLRKDEARIYLHPLVNQFAAARLGDGEARKATEAAHARYFSELLMQLKRPCEIGDREALRRMDAEFENCRTAWQWAVVHEAVDLLRKSLSAIVEYCDHRCRFDEVLAMAEEALRAPAVRADARLEALLLARVAHVQYRLDRYHEAEALALPALDAARTAREHAAQGLCLNVLGSCCLRLGRYEDAGRHFREGLKLAMSRKEPHNTAAALDHIALAEKWMGHYDEALRLSVQSLVAHRGLGDVAGEALCLNNLAALHLARQEYAAAGAHLREGLAVCDRDGLTGTRLYILANLTEVAMKTQDPDAEGVARRAIESAAALGNRPTMALLKLQFARLMTARGDLAAARAELAESLSVSIALGALSLVGAGVMIFAEVLAAQGEVESARRVLAFAADHPSTSIPDRDEVRALLAALPPAARALPAWPGIGLDELAGRIVVEGDVAYAPLIGLLRG
jgi:predicted ATPase/DNA-binding SARP family transcriptional activator